MKTTQRNTDSASQSFVRLFDELATCVPLWTAALVVLGLLSAFGFLLNDLILAILGMCILVLSMRLTIARLLERCCEQTIHLHHLIEETVELLGKATQTNRKWIQLKFFGQCLHGFAASLISLAKGLGKRTPRAIAGQVFISTSPTPLTEKVVVSNFGAIQKLTCLLLVGVGPLFCLVAYWIRLPEQSTYQILLGELVDFQIRNELIGQLANRFCVIGGYFIIQCVLLVSACLICHGDGCYIKPNWLYHFCFSITPGIVFLAILLNLMPLVYGSIFLAVISLPLAGVILFEAKSSIELLRTKSQKRKRNPKQQTKSPLAALKYKRLYGSSDWTEFLQRLRHRISFPSRLKSRAIMLLLPATFFIFTLPAFFFFQEGIEQMMANSVPESTSEDPTLGENIRFFIALGGMVIQLILFGELRSRNRLLPKIKLLRFKLDELPEHLLVVWGVCHIGLFLALWTAVEVATLLASEAFLLCLLMAILERAYPKLEKEVEVETA